MTESSSIQYLWSNKNSTTRKREIKEKEKKINNEQVNLENLLFSERTPSIKSSIIINEQNKCEESCMSWKERNQQSEDDASIVDTNLENQLVHIYEVLEVDKKGRILEYYPPFDNKGRSSQVVPLSVNTSDEEEDESIISNKVNSRGTYHRSQSNFQKKNNKNKKKQRNLLKMKAYLIAKDEFKDKNGNIDPLDYPKDLINKRRDEILSILLNKK